MKIITIAILIIFFPLIINSEDSQNVCFTEKEADSIKKQLDDDRKVIKWQAKRWKELVNAKPKIKYETTDKKVIIQEIEFPVKNDTPLTYKVTFEVNTFLGNSTYFPLKINLGVIVESGAEKFRYVDPKIGLQIFGLEPLKTKFIRNLGFHVLVGVQSTGFSVSWGWMKRPIENLRIHIYTGITYEAKESFGGGITLNF